MSAYNLILDAVVRVRPAANARRASHRCASTALLALFAGAWAAGCSEPTTARTAGAVPGPALSEVVDGATLGCAPRPNVVPKSVEPGTDLDVNGNGIVCEERLGAADVPGLGGAPPLVMDDAIVLTGVE